MKVIAYIQICPAIIIDISGYNTQSVTQRAAVDTGFFSDIHKFIFFFESVFKKFIPRILVLFFSFLYRPVTIDTVNVLIEQIHVQISIAIIIKKCCLGRKTFKSKAVFFRQFFEGAVLLINIK